MGGRALVQLKQLFACDPCDVGSGVVVNEADGAVAQGLALNVTCWKIQMLAVQQLGYNSVAGQPFREEHARAVPLDWTHDHFRIDPMLGSRFRGFLEVPTKIHSAEYLFKEPVSHLQCRWSRVKSWYVWMTATKRLRQQRHWPCSSVRWCSTHFETLENKAKYPQKPNDGWLWLPRSSLKLTCFLLQIVLNQLLQALIVEPDGGSDRVWSLMSWSAAQKRAN